jgi:hypothetical protein
VRYVPVGKAMVRGDGGGRGEGLVARRRFRSAVSWWPRFALFFPCGVAKMVEVGGAAPPNSQN